MRYLLTEDGARSVSRIFAEKLIYSQNIHQGKEYEKSSPSLDNVYLRMSFVDIALIFPFLEHRLVS